MARPADNNETAETGNLRRRKIPYNHRPDSEIIRNTLVKKYALGNIHTQTVKTKKRALRICHYSFEQPLE